MGDGSFPADHLPVTRDRLALLATEIGATSKTPPSARGRGWKPQPCTYNGAYKTVRGPGGGFFTSRLRKPRERLPV